MKQFILFILLLGCFSCGTGNYVKTRNIKVYGTPDVDYYLKNQHSYPDSDGFLKFGASDNIAKICKDSYRLVGSTDSSGYGTLALSSQEYKRGKKCVIAVRSGYNPTEFKLKKRFNTPVLFNLIFPISFFFDHFTVLSTKHINNLKISEQSSHTCFDYMDTAENSLNKEEQIDYLKKAISQDYRNENGVKIDALNKLGVIYGEIGDLHLAYLTLYHAYQEEQNSEIEETIDWLKETITFENRIAAEKREKRERTFNTISMIGNSLTSAGNALASSSGSAVEATVSTVEGSTNKVSKTQSKSSTFGNMNETTSKNQDSNTYSKWEDQLIEMNTYRERYSDSKRKYIQQQMRNLREKWKKKGYNFYQSNWETWTGDKK